MFPIFVHVSRMVRCRARWRRPITSTTSVADTRWSRRERVRRKKMQMREKVGKTRNTAFFQWIVAPEGRKVGSLKRQVRRHLKDDRSAVHLGRCSNHHVLLRSQHRCQVWHGPPSQCLPGRWNQISTVVWYWSRAAWPAGARYICRPMSSAACCTSWKRSLSVITRW